MFRRNSGPLALGASLIALYLVVKNPRGVSTGLREGFRGGEGLVKAFQGR